MSEQPGGVPEGDGGVRSSTILCPYCGRGSRVAPGGGQGHRNSSGQLRRTRDCPVERGGCGQVFFTVEVLVDHPTVEDILVEIPPPGGTGASSYKRYSEAHLAERMRSQLFGLLEMDETAIIAARVTARLNKRMALKPTPKQKANKTWKPVHRPLDEPDKDTGLLFYVRASTIRDYVLRELVDVGRPPGGGGSARYRIAHVMYALATHGRLPAKRRGGNRQGRNEGWRDATEFLRWLTDTYSDLPDLPARRARRAEDRWWRPDQAPEEPRVVIKRHMKLRKRNVRATSSPESPKPSQSEANSKSAQWSTTIDGVPSERFVREKFLRSIESALDGRVPDEREAAENVMSWVLFGLQGQETVLSSQLGAGVADCLRRLDDIAYLRWIIVGKELRVSALHNETVGLIRYPSPRLVLDDTSGMRHTPARLPNDR